MTEKLVTHNNLEAMRIRGLQRPERELWMARQPKREETGTILTASELGVDRKGLDELEERNHRVREKKLQSKERGPWFAR